MGFKTLVTGALLGFGLLFYDKTINLSGLDKIPIQNYSPGYVQEYIGKNVIYNPKGGPIPINDTVDINGDGVRDVFATPEKFAFVLMSEGNIYRRYWFPGRAYGAVIKDGALRLAGDYKYVFRKGRASDNKNDINVNGGFLEATPYTKLDLIDPKEFGADRRYLSYYAKTNDTAKVWEILTTKHEKIIHYEDDDGRTFLEAGKCLGRDRRISDQQLRNLIKYYRDAFTPNKQGEAVANLMLDNFETMRDGTLEYNMPGNSVIRSFPGAR